MHHESIQDDWNRLFDDIKTPYGFDDYVDYGDNVSIDSLKYDDKSTIYAVYDLNTKETINLELDQNPELFDLIKKTEKLRSLLLKGQSWI